MTLRLTAVALALALAAPAITVAEVGGEAQFLETCAACHQPSGQGIKGAFPALAGDAFVVGDPQAVTATVLNGRGGMPAWKVDLNDSQIAAAITYIRSAWGNKASPVTEAMVAAERAKSAPTTARGAQAH